MCTDRCPHMRKETNLVAETRKKPKTFANAAQSSKKIVVYSSFLENSKKYLKKAEVPCLTLLRHPHTLHSPPLQITRSFAHGLIFYQDLLACLWDPNYMTWPHGDRLWRCLTFPFHPFCLSWCSASSIYPGFPCCSGVWLPDSSMVDDIGPNPWDGVL